MTSWNEFAAAAPRISTIFTRRHAATGNLCMLATLRKDSFPRISPLEPRVFEGELWLVGMPNTTKFADLARDPRFCLHTATVDTHVSDGDVKLFGTVHDVQDPDLHRRFADALFEETGFDLRGRKFEPFYAADITGASSVEIVDGRLEVTIWKPGQVERVVEVSDSAEPATT
ncbi:pyridoxamine 5'-phosphate oxidase family protein [Nocardia sp. CDC160]|uniref:pyridoxamine 5'-phosphate oxidase family protein n=1 Tax=Nocardia sp. CDC160 TaxID=3112166 RepID=UPI002DBFDAAD|nr:pyridoxamine 5'-phosphate oxidase family protein [Nocardia sp. CDC160]MEC3917777.1 pyridoxamine 5'-phosphate oxidase family protein [Nocardia sp. CDC160]